MGKPTEGNIKGAQQHAEGQHGQKTLDRLQEINASQSAGTPQREEAEAREGNSPGRLKSEGESRSGGGEGNA
jgi:hypothetical protein